MAEPRRTRYCAGVTLPGSTVGWVLSGGAARGAYEAGVLRFILVDLARQLGRPTWPDVVSGTSVGALNGVFAAARDAAAVRTLSNVWQTMTIGDVFRFEPTLVLRKLLRPREGEEFAVLDPAPFHALVARLFPEAALRRAIDSGATRAFIVAATEVATGFNSLFVDGHLRFPVQPGSRLYHTHMTAAHCRASAAIPFVFPPVAVDGRFHVDGGLRQNTPLRPVLASSVQRALIVGLKRDREEEAAAALRAEATISAARLRTSGRGQALRDPRAGLESPGLIFLAGKMLNALMLDPVERDLWSAEYRNALVQWGVRRFGDTFATQAASDLGLRDVDIVYLRPTVDLGRVAGETFRSRPPKTTRAVRFLLERVVGAATEVEADFLSYLYFDRDYTGQLEALGYEDAKRNESAIAQLYAPP